MSTKQYTIRNIPEAVDRYLRRRAKLSGQSLNQVVVDELSERVSKPGVDIVDSLDWFIGSGGVGEDVERALADDDKLQKRLTKKQWRDDDC